MKSKMDMVNSKINWQIVGKIRSFFLSERSMIGPSFGDGRKYFKRIKKNAKSGLTLLLAGHFLHHVEEIFTKTKQLARSRRWRRARFHIRIPIPSQQTRSQTHQSFAPRLAQYRRELAWHVWSVRYEHCQIYHGYVRLYRGSGSKHDTNAVTFVRLLLSLLMVVYVRESSPVCINDYVEQENRR